MKIALKTTLTVVALCMASGCDVGPEDEEFDDGESEALGEAEAPVCWLPSNPTPDTTRTLDYTHDSETVNSPSGGYGNDECSYYSVAFIQGVSGSATPYAIPTDPTVCENTTIRAQFYGRTTSTWSYLTTVTKTGVWSNGTCTNLSVGHGPINGYDIQVRAQVRRFVPGSLSYSVNERVEITGTSVIL